MCGKHYVNEGSLRKHLACHPETSQLSTSLRMWPCSVCQAVFTHESGIQITFLLLRVQDETLYETKQPLSWSFPHTIIRRRTPPNSIQNLPKILYLEYLKPEAPKSRFGLFTETKEIKSSRLNPDLSCLFVSSCISSPRPYSFVEIFTFLKLEPTTQFESGEIGIHKWKFDEPFQTWRI